MTKSFNTELIIKYLCEINSGQLSWYHRSRHRVSCKFFNHSVGKFEMNIKPSRLNVYYTGNHPKAHNDSGTLQGGAGNTAKGGSANLLTAHLSV